MKFHHWTGWKIVDIIKFTPKNDLMCAYKGMCALFVENCMFILTRSLYVDKAPC